jgi:hypothetical protein
MVKKITLLTTLTLIVLWIAAGCAGQPTPVPTPTATPPPIAPLVLRTVPERGQEQPLDAPIEIVFDQPMDQVSVEKAFAIEPGASVDGAFSWPDERTMRFQPTGGFERAARYKVRLVESAQSQAGLTLQAPFELRFSAAGFLEVTTTQPSDKATEILPDTVVTVMFNRPVVALSALEEASTLPDPLTFVPPVTGQGEWLNTSVYQFTPDENALRPATAYTARVAQGLADATGSAELADDFEWTFTTVSPKALASSPASGDIYVSPTPVISLTFNQPMNRQDVEAKFSLTPADGEEAIPGQFVWAEGPLPQPTEDDDDDGYYEYEYDEGEGPAEVGVETVGFYPAEALELGAEYLLTLPPGTEGAAPGAVTPNGFEATFTVSPYPEIVSIYPADGDTGVSPWESLQVSFSAPMNPESLVFGENLFITPQVSVTEVYTYWWSSDTELEIEFPTEASSNYRVILGPGLKGRYGHPITATETVAWETRAATPWLQIYSPGRVALYNAYTDTLLYAGLRNADRAQFALYRLPHSDFIDLTQSGWWEEWDLYQPLTANLVSEWELAPRPALDLNTAQIFSLDLAEKSGLDADRLPPGLYYLEGWLAPEDVYPEAQGYDYSLETQRLLLVVSKYNLTFKNTNNETLAWATDLQSGQPVKSLPLTFFAGQRRLGRASTGADGVGLAEYQKEADDNYILYAFAGDPAKPGENFAVTSSEWTNGIDRYNFDDIYTEDYLQPYNAYLYTERNIYRPGQTVYYKGILRADDDAHYSLPTAGGDVVAISITDSQGKQVLSDTLTLSEMGTINGDFKLDENAVLGTYSIEAAYADEVTFYGSFQVAAYRKPEYLVTVATDKSEYTQGETVVVTATAEFFTGGPVSDAPVRWTVLSADYFFHYQGKGFYDFTDYDYSRGYDGYSYDQTLAEGEGTTDAEGRFTFEVPADIADKLASQQLTLDVVITDINNQEVAGQATAVVHKGQFYIGLRPERYVGQVETESTLNVIVVDWESEPVAGQEVQLVFAEHNWYSAQKQYEDGSFYWESWVEDVPVYTTTVTTAGEGLATASFTPTKGGIYKVFASATDAAENEVLSSTYMWISGRQYVNWRQENNDRLDLVADKREYNVGDIATILVPHPYDGPVMALVTTERGHIYSHFVTELETNSDQIEIEITEEMLPNLYVSVVVAKGVDETNALPGFKLGYASLPINSTAKQLQITLTPNKPAAEKYQPGDTAEYQVTVTDVAGEPVKAELSLALVDKAVLALAPQVPGQLLNTFWRERGLGVSTAGGLTMAMDRVNVNIAPDAKGGGGGFEQEFGDVRSNFQETALWVADLMTDDNGQATVKASLPDNLTTWTMTAMGVTGADTLVGDGTVEIVSAKPLMVRPVAPRFFIVNDEVRLGLIVQNNTDQPLEVETFFEATGLTIEPASDTPTVKVAAGERVKVEYNVVAGSAATATLKMGAKASGFEDALAIEIPIHRYSTPETVATAGILEEDGVRTEGIALPASFDPTQGDLSISIDPSLAAGMRDGLDYLEHFPHECTEQTVSRFLPNVFTYRAYQELGLENPELAEKLPELVSLGLQRLYAQQHIDGGWGWWILDDSDPHLTAYVLLGLVEARRAGFTVDDGAIDSAADYLEGSLDAPKDITVAWKANRQAFILYALAEAGEGDLGRAKALFEKREQLDTFGRAYLAMALHILDEEAPQIETLLSDISGAAIVSATGAHWEEAQVDYYAMNTDTRSTAIIIAALARIQPDNPLAPNAVRWLMSVREHGGHWETTQETAWAIIGLTDWMAATGELEGNYAWSVALNGASLGTGEANADTIGETVKLRAEVRDLLADTVNRVTIERDPVGTDVSGSPGRLYYAAYLTYYKPVEEIKALDRGIIVSRQYQLQGDETGQAISAAEVGDVIAVRLTIIAPNDLHYVVVEDPIPAGTEGIDKSLATTSVAEEDPDLTRTDRGNPWGDRYGSWFFSHAEMRDEKAVLYASYLPKGTYEYTYLVRATLPGAYRALPTHAEEMYFPEVFGRSDGGVFKVSQ